MKLTSPLRHRNGDLRIDHALPPSRDLCSASAVEIITGCESAASGGGSCAGSKFFDQEGRGLREGRRGRVGGFEGYGIGGCHCFGPFRERGVWEGWRMMGLRRAILRRWGAGHDKRY